jgi:diacylglycerol kinase family enzyme
VPHPGITQRSGAGVTVSIDRRVALEVDGRPAPATDLVDITVVPNAYRLLL